MQGMFKAHVAILPAISSRYAVTSANVHNSKRLPRLLDPENKRDSAWADQVYSSKEIQDPQDHAGFDNLIQNIRLEIIQFAFWQSR